MVKTADPVALISLKVARTANSVAAARAVEFEMMVLNLICEQNVRLPALEHAADEAGGSAGAGVGAGAGPGAGATAATTCTVEHENHEVEDLTCMEHAAHTSDDGMLILME